MDSLKLLIDRCRHRRGFGVHSPAAFMLVREIVRPIPSYRYYAEDRLDNLRLTYEELKLFRIVIRLYGRLKPYEFYLQEKTKLADLLAKEKIGRRCRVLCERKGEEVLSPVPFSRLLFKTKSGHMGEVKVYGPLNKGHLERLREEDAVLIEGRDFTIYYRTPGLSPIHVTV